MAGALTKLGLVAALTALAGGYAAVGGVEPPAAPAPVMRPVAEQDPIRTTEDEAFAYAAKIGARVEVGAYRSESRSVFAGPDGTLTSNDYAEPVRVSRAGGWVPTDATLARAADGSIVPRAVGYGLRLSGGGTGPLLTAERAGRSISLDWPGRLPAPDLSGDRATYAEVLPGVDLVVNAGVTTFSHVLVIKTAEAALNPDLATLDFGLKTEGLEVRGTGSGGLAAVDVAAGGAVFEAAAPTMWDSGEPAPAALKASAAAAAPATAVEKPIGVAVTGRTLRLTPDRAMLTSPRTRFPVYVDPLWTDTRNSGWAMVAKGYPAEEYWKFDGKDTEGVGKCPVSSGTCASVDTKRLFYALPTPFSGKTILSAELAVTMTMADYDRDVSVYRATGGISSSTNWGNQPGQGTFQDSQSPTATKSSCTSTNQNVRFDVHQAIGDAARLKWSTTTFLVRAANEGDDKAWKRFCGNALLSVRYNRAPNTPAQSNLTMNPGGACVYGTNRPYSDVPPTLNAILSDPDKTSSNAEQLTAEFKIYWTPAGGAQVVKTYKTGKKASGSTFSLNTATASGLTLPEGTVIGWEVRANDSSADGQWSSYGDQTQCEFILDRTSPSSPDIDSAEYLPLDRGESTGACVPDEIPPAEGEEGTSPSWRGWVGMYGTFTFDSAATDVVEYWYGFDENPSATHSLKPTADGGPVSVVWMPESDGPHTINVLAKDKAKKSSVIASCTFHVPLRLSAHEYGLADEGPAAADQRGTAPAAAGDAVTFGVPGPACTAASVQCSTDHAVRLTGAAGSYLSTAGTAWTVDTGAPFSISAWVRLSDDTQDRTAVSQDGSGAPGFVLGFSAATKKWIFGTPASPVNPMGDWTASSTAAATTGTWTHLAGVVDPVKATITLYVNGVAQPAAVKRSQWRSQGALQIGRSLDRFGYGRMWTGDVADVNVFDRIVVPREAKALAFQRAQRTAYWPLDEATDGVSAPYDDSDGPGLTLAGGARIRTADLENDPPGDWPMVGSGDLFLDGIDDYAATARTVAATGTSFTVSVRARLAAGACTRTMAVLAQAGTKESGFTIRCTADNRWEAVLPRLDGTDAAKPPVVLQGALDPSADLTGQQLVLVYDAFRQQATFYVNGQAMDTSVGTFTTPWSAGGVLTTGRALRGGTYGDYFAGVVDEARVYAGVLDEANIQRLGNPTPDPEL